MPNNFLAQIAQINSNAGLKLEKIKQNKKQTKKDKKQNKTK